MVAEVSGREQQGGRAWARAATVVALAACLGVAACGGGSDEAEGPSTAPSVLVPTPSTDAGRTATSADADDEEESTGTTLPPGAEPGVDDYDGNGDPDPTCGTQDFGAGLVLRIPCEITTPNEPEEGSTLVEGSLYRLPGTLDVNLDGISGSLLAARDVAGRKVRIVVFNSDNLFATGSDEIGSTDTMDNTIGLINRLFPGSAIQVRGHTDATGSAEVNQQLSEGRAATVRDYLLSHGVVAAEVTSVGLGAERPLAAELSTDGGVSEDGQRFNRRVELVLRVP